MPRNLLVVDDSATIRDAVRYSLAGEDWTVAAAADVAEALEAIRGGAVDAVICDASLTPDDGYGACRTLRSAMGDAPVPIVLMGGKVSENLAASAGATAVLAKPFESQELLEVLQAGMEQGSFDVAADDFAPLGGEEEVMAPEVAAPVAPTAPGPVAEEEVEIIDLSGDDEAEDLELLQDLQPLPQGPAPAAAAPESSSQEWDLEGLLRPLDLEEVAAPEEAESEPRYTGPVEFDLDDLGGEGEEEPPPAQELGFARTATGDAERLVDAEEEAPELDLDDLDLDLDLAPVVSAAPAEDFPPSPREPAAFETPLPTEDLLGDIDLEGWAEEAAEPVAGAPEPPRPEPPAPGGAEAGVEFIPESVKEPTTEALTEPSGAIEEGFDAEPAPATEPWEEEPLELEDTEVEAPFGTDELPEAPEPEEEPFRGLEAPARPEEPEVEEGYVGDEDEEVEAPAEVPEAYEAWPGPSPEPAVGAAWDQPSPAAEALAEPVARAAEEAVRQALAQSLSPEALTPLVQATVERVVWEVVPQLAERLIREAIERLQEDPAGD